MDFATLPPEINSARLYSGAGASSILAAAAAWDQLARELNTSAAAYRSVIAALTTDGWLGPSSMMMANAATPYVAWMHGTAAQAEQTAVQAKGAAAAYEVALAAIVPPQEIAANRALLLKLVAGNYFGQNSPAIAATEAHYDAMWAQDAAVMQGYRASSATASDLTPFAAAPATAAAQSIGNPAQAAPAFSATDVFNDTVSSLSGAASVSSSSFGGASIGTANHAIAVNAERDEAQGLGPFLGIGAVPPIPTPPTAVTQPAVLAAMGRGNIAGTLSVPQAWAATPTPVVSPTPAAAPAIGAASVPSAPAALPPGMFGETMLGTLAGRGVSNAVAKLRRPSVIPRSPAAG